MFIDGFSIAGYRSFGNELQKIAPCGKINIFIGQNNSGKSNILLFLYTHYRSVIEAIQNKNRNNIKFDDIDYHIDNKNKELKLGIGINLKGEVYSRLKKDTSIDETQRKSFEEYLDKIVGDNAFTYGNQFAWFIYTSRVKNSIFEIDKSLIKSLIENNKNNQRIFQM